MTFTYSKALTLLLSSILLSFSALLHAGGPVWTFTPLTATSVSVPANGTATIQYQVTNQSAKSHSLVMTPITGITQTTTGAGICSNPFTLPSRGSSCTLSLQVNGSQLTHPITDGPIVCEQGSALQCYKPSPSNVLSINVGINEYTIGGMVSGLSDSVVLQNNGTDNETVSSDGVFTFSTAISEGSPYAVTVLTQPTGQTCTVTNCSGTVGSANVTNVSATCVSNDTTLTASVSTLGLSVNNTGLNTALTGTPRLITITNSGSNPATSVTYSLSPDLPSGTTISPSSCGTIAVSGTCVLTITPGSTASATAGDTSPTPITLSISGTNTNTLTPTVNILTYGSVYQGGYIYAVDDTTPDIGSIGGKVAGLINVSNSNQWTSTNENISGAESSTNGAQNTTDILASSSCTNSTTNCAAYQCRINFTGGGNTDWYLPAICEEGYDSFGFGSGCGTSGSPTLQNMQSNLVDNGNVGSLSGNYWSSTEFTGNTTDGAWYQVFALGNSFQTGDFKDSSLGVRCSRALTL